jgi:hypothetical protein
MKWNIIPTRKAEKLIEELPNKVKAAAHLLFREMAVYGPDRKEWPNYSKLQGLKGQKKSDDIRHCHLKKGRPTYVACWQVYEKKMKIEVTYVGTHEKAPY